MRRRISYFVLIGPLAALLLSTPTAAATVTVIPTGQFPNDRNALQSALASARPGDVIQLGAGIFNLSGPPSPLIVATPNVAVIGSGTGSTVLDGPGLSARSAALRVLSPASGFMIQGVEFHDFMNGVVGLADVNGVAVIGCRFDGVLRAVVALGQGSHSGWRIAGNEITTAMLDDFRRLGGGAVLTLSCAVDAIVTDNVVTGPGADPTLTNSAAFSSAALTMKTPSTCSTAGHGGLVARNRASGFDVALESAASDVVFEGNEVTASHLGIVVGTFETSDPPTVGVHVVDNRSAGNTEFGVLLIGAQHTLVLGNDLKQNGERAIGVLDGSLASPPVPSTDNEFRHNTDNSVEQLVLNPTTFIWTPAHGDGDFRK